MPGGEVRHLAYGAVDTLDGCGGLLLTGGGDVHPRHYGRLDAMDFINNVDERRDEFEFQLIEEALTLRIPVLGICRGAQIFAVARGGTLVPDIEHAGHPSHRKIGMNDRVHGVTVEPGSQLLEITGMASGHVNSSHHQAVNSPGGELVISARSDDGVSEALEWREPAGRPFLLLVQWHPERMVDAENPFAKNIMQRFVQEIAKTGI